jgi:hypothetical protein
VGEKYGAAWIDTKILACQSFGKPKFWPHFSWVPKFIHLSHFFYQNVGKLFAQHLSSQNFGMPKFWHQSKQAHILFNHTAAAAWRASACTLLSRLAAGLGLPR